MGTVKGTNHKVEECNKRILNEARKQTQPINDTNSYASEVISSTKPREIIQHPSTIFKIKKKAIEKNNLNFPPLSVENTYINQPILTPRPSLSDSSISSDEQVFQILTKPTIPPYFCQNQPIPLLQTLQTLPQRQNKLRNLKKTFLIPSLAINQSHSTPEKENCTEIKIKEK